jgi:hypothetical protein
MASGMGGGCGSKSFRRTAASWTKGSDADADKVFVPLTPEGLETGRYSAVRLDLEAEASSEVSSGGPSIERALDYSNDGGVTWGNVATFDTTSGWIYPTGDPAARDYGTEFASVSEAYQLFRVGVVGKNRTGGTELEVLRVTGTIHLKPR